MHHKEMPGFNPGKNPEKNPEKKSALELTPEELSILNFSTPEQAAKKSEQMQREWKKDVAQGFVTPASVSNKKGGGLKRNYISSAGEGDVEPREVDYGQEDDLGDEE